MSLVYRVSVVRGTFHGLNLKNELMSYYSYYSYHFLKTALNMENISNLTKAKLLLLKLIHLFARKVLLVKKLEIKGLKFDSSALLVNFYNAAS